MLLYTLHTHSCTCTHTSVYLYLYTDTDAGEIFQTMSVRVNAGRVTRNKGTALDVLGSFAHPHRVPTHITHLIAFSCLLKLKGHGRNGEQNEGRAFVRPAALWSGVHVA